MPDDTLLAAFDHCLDALAAGEELEVILARYPALRSELEPMLAAAETAADYSASLAPPRHVESANRARFLARAAALRQRRQPAAGGWARWGLWAWAAAHRLATVSLVIVLALGLSAYGVAAAAGNSLPGEPLYGVKRTVEQAQLALAVDVDARARLEREFAERRVSEVERLATNGRTAQVAFSGILEAMNGERWSVAGLAVVVSDRTQITGTPLAGLHVSIEGALLPDGTVEAARVVVDGLVVSGEVQSQAGNQWLIAGEVVRVDGRTIITGAPRVGDQVSVSARRAADGSLLALRITLTGTVETPPSPTAAPTATLPTPTTGATNESPAATETPASPTPTVAMPTPTPTVTQAPLPSATPQATDDDDDGEDDGDDDDDDNSGPSASNTPGPEETDEPDETDEPGDGDEAEGEEVRWEGTVEATGAVWVVGGQSVTVTGATEINGSPQVGDTVEVRAVPQGDGSLVATRIDKK